MNCDVGEATEGLSFAHSPTFSSLHLRHNSFSNPSVALPMSQLILQPFSRFTYVTDHSPTLPLLHLRHSSFSNSSFASPTSQVLHLCHLASRSWKKEIPNNPINKNLPSDWKPARLLNDPINQGRPNYGPRASCGPPTPFLWPASTEWFCHFSGLVSRH